VANTTTKGTTANRRHIFAFFGPQNLIFLSPFPFSIDLDP
jgi:hypothetical protein